MKLLLLYFTCCLFSFTVASQNTQHFIANDSARHIGEMMYEFFTETLNQNFSGEDEQELYVKFLNSCFGSIESNIDKYPNICNLTIDKNKLNKINRKLFIRNGSHYYYFFPEIILVESEDNLETAKPLFNKYPDIPIALHKTRDTTTKKKLIFANYYQLPIVVLIHDKGFIEDLQKEDLKIFQYVTRQMELSREIHYYYISKYILNEAKSELQYRKVRKMLAIVYWKYLCLQADIDFHKPLKDYEWRKFENF